ncbi:unnamed protein product [Rotaria sp. Silwood2]|nr:unnamed protein product [Rotaria sp. Silwood2]
MAVYCDARAAEDFFRFEQKRGCVPIGGACNVASDCCGYYDGDTGHCVLCTGIIDYFFNTGGRTCGCSHYSVGVDPNDGRVVTDICNGRDRSSDGTSSPVCRTRVAPPGDNYYRSDDYYYGSYRGTDPAHRNRGGEK